MSRWLLVLLALLLPLQLAWAGVGAHCGDAHDGAMAHGLQVADERGLEGLDGPDDHDGTASPDGPHCHGHVSALPLAASSVAVSPARQALHRQAAPRVSAIPPPRPERPQWPALA